MAKINPINYEVFGRRVSNEDLPVLPISQNATIEGSIDTHIAGLTGIDSLQPQIYRVLAPTGVESRYSRVQPELYADNNNILDYSIKSVTANNKRISWRFDPSAISGVEHSQLYGVEFLINEADDASIAQFDPSFVVEVDNKIDFTGITGAQGSSFFGITGPQGETGAQGQKGETGVLGATDYVDFTPQSSSPSFAEGRMWYEDSSDTMVYYPQAGESGVMLNSGEVNFRVYNQSGADIPNGTGVAVQDAFSGAPSIILMDASVIGTSLLGVTTQEIPNNTWGWVTAAGTINDYDTSGYVLGQALWASTTVAGGFQTFPPTGPGNQVSFVGWVTRVNASTGRLMINVSIPIHYRYLADLRDTFGLTGAQTGELLGLNDAGTYWEPKKALVIEDSSFEGVRVDSDGNLGLGTTGVFGSGQGVLGIANASSVPSTTPSGGGVLYVEGGALKFRGSAGTITTIAPA